MATKLEPWPYRQGDTDKPTPAEGVTPFSAAAAAAHADPAKVALLGTSYLLFLIAEGSLCLLLSALGVGLGVAVRRGRVHRAPNRG